MHFGIFRHPLRQLLYVDRRVSAASLPGLFWRTYGRNGGCIQAGAVPVKLKVGAIKENADLVRRAHRVATERGVHQWLQEAKRLSAAILRILCVGPPFGILWNELCVIWRQKPKTEVRLFLSGPVAY